MSGIDIAIAQPDRIRLHITPFNAELYDRIIPPSLQPLATDRSFHTIQTFPDKGYGFVELPAMEAQKLRKKLNGSTLKGTKMSVEEARPAKKRKSGADFDGEESERKKAKREKKERRKTEDGVLAGHEMEEGRRVKRGWTGDDSRERKDKKQGKERKAKESPEERKLRFKTKVPPNKAPLEGEKEKKKKDKKSKKGESKDQVVVEEFTKRRKSKQGVSIVDGAASGSTSYVEGRGWLDEDGNVVEPERKSKRRKKQPSASPEAPPPDAAAAHDTVAGAEEEQPDATAHEIEEAIEQSESSESADSNSNDDDDELPPDTPISQPTEVHPLEALFKRPAPSTDAAKASANSTPSRPRPAPIDTSFSFFGVGNAEAEEDTEMGEVGGVAMPPVTPHTKQDLEWRSLRSAAPTPDTAAIGRKFSFPFANQSLDEGDEDIDDEDEQDEDEQMLDARTEAQVNGAANAGGRTDGVAGGDGRGEESTFRKWFFENRGDLNRGWKKRRREERKVKRQRENRRLGRKVA